MPDRVRSQQRRRRRPRTTSLGGAVAALAWGYAWRQMVRRSRLHEAVVAAAEPEMTAYETSDWDLWPVGLVYLGTVALLVLSCLVLMVAYPDSMHDVSRTLHIAPPGPHLQTNPAGDLATFRSEEEKQLDTYYWVHRQKALVHIPIEEAMKKLVRTGIPGFPKAQP
jgi:hypothetical protein